MNQRTLVTAGIVSAVLVALVPQPLRAAPLIGTFSLSGELTLGATTIDWSPLGGATGSVNVTAATGDFTAPDIGTAKDLNTVVQPVGVPFFLNAFLTFAGQPDELDLTHISPGIFLAADCFAAPAAGQTCTPPGSAFSLENLSATSSLLRFTMFGVATDPGTGNIGAFIATYVSVFNSFPYQTLLAVIAAGGTVTASYVAAYEVGVLGSVPEPSLLLLMATGVVGFVGVRLRWSRARSAKR